jgi:hypothetical protein
MMLPVVSPVILQFLAFLNQVVAFREDCARSHRQAIGAGEEPWVDNGIGRDNRVAHVHRPEHAGSAKSRHRVAGDGDFFQKKRPGIRADRAAGVRCGVALK